MDHVKQNLIGISTTTSKNQHIVIQHVLKNIGFLITQISLHYFLH